MSHFDAHLNSADFTRSAPDASAHNFHNPVEGLKDLLHIAREASPSAHGIESTFGHVQLFDSACQPGPRGGFPQMEVHIPGPPGGYEHHYPGPHYDGNYPPAFGGNGSDFNLNLHLGGRNGLDLNINLQGNPGVYNWNAPYEQPGMGNQSGQNNNGGEQGLGNQSGQNNNGGEQGLGNQSGQNNNGGEQGLGNQSGQNNNSGEQGLGNQSGQDNGSGQRTADNTNNNNEAVDSNKPADNNRDLAAENKALEDWATKTLPTEDAKNFIKNKEDFEARAQKDGVSPQEVLDTLKQVDRIATAPSNQALSDTQRQHIAESVMKNAAHPTEISQGHHNTCNVTSVESRTYTRNPAEAAKLVADVSTTGQYTAHDGTTVKIDPTPSDQSNTWPPKDTQRSNASQIFETTAVNLHYAKVNAQNGTDIRYEQTSPQKGDLHDTGERLTDYSKNPPEEVKKADGTNVRAPNLTDRQIVDVSNQITGQDEKGILLSALDTQCDQVFRVDSEQDLRDQLAQLKENHQLPVIVRVEALNEPFFNDSGQGAAGGAGGAHAVTITDYDENTGKVSVANQWGKHADHSQGNPIDAHDLFIAMQSTRGAEKILQDDVDNNKANGVVDTAKEMDLIRHELHNHDVPVETIEQQTKQLIDDSHSQSATSSAKDKQTESTFVDHVIHAMPGKGELTLAEQAHQEGVINDTQYQKDLVYAGRKINREDAAKGGDPIMNQGGDAGPKPVIPGEVFNKQGLPCAPGDENLSVGQAELNKALSALPEADRHRIQSEIDDTSLPVE